MHRLVLGLALALFIGGAAQAGETPKEGLAAIVKLFQERDAGTLIRQRYAEVENPGNEEEIAEVVDYFEKQIIGKDTTYKRVLALFTAAQAVEPTLSDDGKKAVFTTEDGRVDLRLMPSGLWGFRM